ncbi:MAG: hypothetical protein GWO02_14745 [Gammaproteobacteria bacterium]|nr:hypothetical protein [Gammaproteobacteria bacterium]
MPASSDLDVVSNPAPVRGGRGAEDVDEAEERAPRRLRHRDRVVTAEDFKARALDTPGVTRPQPPQPASRPGGGFAPAPSLGSGIRDSDVTTLHGDTLASLEEAPGLERSTLRRSRSALDRAAQSARAAIRLLEQPDAAAAALRRATDRLRLDERRLAALMPAIRAAAERAPRVSRERLGSTIKGAERQAEEARNRRDRVKSAFQHTDQQKNQLYQALSRVLRTMNDMRRLGAASRSGL